MSMRDIVTREEFEELSPLMRGFVVYMMGKRDDQPHVPNEECPYPPMSKEAFEWVRGQVMACQAAHDSVLHAAAILCRSHGWMQRGDHDVIDIS